MGIDLSDVSTYLIYTLVLVFWNVSQKKRVPFYMYILFFISLFVVKIVVNFFFIYFKG